VVSMLVSNRGRPEPVIPVEARPRTTSDTAASRAAASSATEAPPAPAPAAPTAAPAVPTAAPVAEAKPTAVPSMVSKREQKREERLKSARQAEPQPSTKIAQAVPPVAANPNRPKTHFCAEVGRTGYFQGVPKEVPQGFKDVAGLPARDDAARIRIRIAVRPEEPVEGQDFTVVATFDNGGDGAFRVARIEESSPGARGGFQPVAGISTPTVVDEAGKLEIFRTTRALGAGETWHKSFRVVEQRRNDAWEASVTVKPCVEQ